MAHTEEEAAAVTLINKVQATLQSAPDEALTYLKQIKHSLIGHDQAKKLYVENNIIQLLVKILEVEHGLKDLKLEAGICIGSLSYGGEYFASRLLQERALEPLIASLNLSTSSPRLVLSSLRTLNTLFDTCPSETSTTSNSIAAAITQEYYSNRYALRYTQKILSQTSPSPWTQQQISLAATLVSKTCRHGGAGEKAAANMEKYQILLYNNGILEALGRRLAGFIIRGKDADDANASKGAQFAPVLDAISVIIKNNSSRAYDLLYAPWILNAFPHAQGKSKVSKSKSAASQPKNITSTPISPSILTSSAFPSLAVAASYFPGGIPRSSYAENRPSSASDIMADIESSVNTPTAVSDNEESPRKTGKRSRQIDTNVLDESPLVRWLISAVRAGDALTRLMAASLLTNLCPIPLTGSIAKRIENMVLPVLVRLLDEETQSSIPPEHHKGGAAVGGHQLPQRLEWIIQERAPAVLADLINDRESMQKAAADAHAIKKLASMLKKTFDLAPSGSAAKETNGVLGMKPLGVKSTPEDDAEENMRTIGSEINSPYKIHRMKVRESTLRCLAGLASRGDEHRKMVIDSGVVPYIVAALHPISEHKLPNAVSPSAPAAKSDESSTPGPNIIKEGNPPRVLIAAAYAIRSLSRSDEDVEVRNAATMALCNLVLQFSPMRQATLDMGILKILCEQAHSSHADLRLNSMWALKHLVYEAENEIKTSALAQLGTGWLVDLISRDDDDIGPYLGDEVEYEDEDEGMADESEDIGYEAIRGFYRGHTPQAEDSGEESDVNQMKDSIGQLSRRPAFNPEAHSPTLPTPSSFVEHETTARALRRAREQLLGVQEQGLDFLRNLICGNDATEILDILFTGVGQERVYDILTRKLRPRPIVTHSPRRSSRRPTTASSTESTPQLLSRIQKAEILIPVIYILVHIAANHPRHRESLIRQKDLLKTLLPLLDHEHKEVRVGLVWVIINLTWKDDGADEVSCRARAMELKTLGFVQKLEGLLQDKVLDVKERAKTALYQIKLCLGEA
ncbi:armadillo-type protein [Kalaharituber pfeilii]|nr:armadillo-type protein [Kalaharituber pfeilii]